MNYAKIYRSLIERARNRDTPSCYCEKHHVIPKSHGGSDDPSNIVALTAREHFVAHWLLKKIHNDKSMIYAFFAMTKPVGNGRRRYTSWSFKYARESMAIWLSENRSGENHPLYGVKGSENPNFGSKRSVETRMKLSKKAKERKGISSRSKMIKCLETGEVFKSISSAKKTHSEGNINYALRTGGKAGGLTFRYLDDKGKEVEPREFLNGYPKGADAHNSIKIKNSKTGEEFDTARDAAKSIGVTPQAIMISIREKRACKGVYFEKI